MNIDIGDLYLKCIKTAIEHGIALFEVTINSRKSNRLHDLCFKYFKKLKSQGSQGIDLLLNLLSHDSDYVRYNAAVHLLSVEPEKAKGVLTDLATRPGIFGFTVEMVLKEWDKGKLRDYLA